MDTRIKATFEYLKYSTEEVIDRKSFELDLRKEVLFEIRESDDVQATFFFDEKAVRLEYEDNEYGRMKPIRSGKSFSLSSGQDDGKSYFPGWFSFRVITDSESNDCLFAVSPANLGYEYIHEIRKYVNSFYYGLSNDIRRKRRGYDAEEKEHIPNASENYTFLLNRMPRILTCISQYIEARPEDAVRTQVISGAYRKLGSASFRWLTRKGMTENDNVYSPDQILIRKTVFNLDHPENRQFKSELLFWNNELGKIIRTVSGYQNQLRSLVDEKVSEISRMEQEYRDIEREKQVSSRIKAVKEGKLRDEKKRVIEINDHIREYDLSLKKLRNYKSNLEYVIFSTWVKQIRQESLPMRCADSRLRLLAGIRNEYMGIKRRNRRSGSESDHFVFREKNTPKLFETYIYILLINLFKEQGYEVENLDAENEDLIFRLSSAGTVILKKEDGSVQIIYDYQLQRTTDHFEEDTYAVVPSTRADRPDFILSFRDQEGNLLDTKIVEVKWRRLNMIYNEKGETDVMLALFDYSNIRYCLRQPVKKTLKGIVSRVIVVYPDREQKMTEVSDDICMIGLLPGADIQQEAGYQNLRKELFREKEED